MEANGSIKNNSLCRLATEAIIQSASRSAAYLEAANSARRLIQSRRCSTGSTGSAGREFETREGSGPVANKWPSSSVARPRIDHKRPTPDFQHPASDTRHPATGSWAFGWPATRSANRGEEKQQAASAARESSGC